MRIILFLATAITIAASCSNNNSAETAQLFCDTTCNSDTFMFKGDHKLEPFVSISQKNCLADTLTWSHKQLETNRQMQIPNMLDNTIRINKNALSVFIKDTSFAVVTFNDCVTGRGYLLKLPFNKKQNISKRTSALNSFDKKFVVPDDLRAYADYSTIYVMDVTTGKEEIMSFKEEYDINFNDVHKTIDSINISRNRIFVLLKKDGKDVPLEKQINL
ncbi:MAG: hypothetical protein ACO1NX_09255 [Chitinophagaceae bacterium]